VAHSGAVLSHDGASDYFDSEDTPVELAALKMRKVDPNSSDRESHRRNDAEPGSRPISLLSFLQAENVRLRRAVVESSLHVKALREVLTRMEAPNAS
jgi:hypothetical protein